MASNAMGTPEQREARRDRAMAREGMSGMRAGAPEVVQTTDVVAPRDRVRWGPIWGGLVATFAAFLLLETLAAGLGLVTPSNGGMSAWTTGIIALVAFFVGGWVAEATSAVRGAGAGALNGLMVWALGITLFLLLSLFGLSTLFGALGNVIGQFFAAGHTISLPGGVNTPTTSSVANTTQAAAWGAFFTLLISAIAAALGGWLASRGKPIGYVGRPMA